jgi:hypothetical protein
MIKLKWNFPDFHTKEKNETLEKMRKYGLHASEVDILEEGGEL